MDKTIRGIDEMAYRALKGRAALEGCTIGELINRAIGAYLDRSVPVAKRGTLRHLVPEPFPAGNEKLSEEIDSIVYGG